ncbi:NAD(P)H-hydrate dehydratase [Candidatus Woesearchaeota archaeon CG_4_10_14_0_2_um_filter_57_5]|nr:MAG: NAD(P)H-hydrate dehydratase [Candidatus Woesearchaeota archaeon CG1_02_57_44]PIZ55652.1 MAG: NAD(P)H-hydrate dehydratase [Candidatus Woesearchaeota archaeon CG_4_10_14_0_2_um_filter_57_5]
MPRIIPALKPRLPSSHKGQNGKVLIVAGSPEFPGAAALCGMAALAVLRSGSDLVYLAAPTKVAWAVNAITPDVITIKLPGARLAMSHLPSLRQHLAGKSCLLMGPGMSAREARIGHRLQVATAQQAIQQTVPLVLDAEMVRALRGKRVFPRDCVITPHRSELGSMGYAAREPTTSAAARAEAKRLQGAMASFLTQGNVVLLKGRYDLVVSSDRIHVNATGNEGMTVGGTGDVLAGVVAGIIAQGNKLFDAAVAAAYAVGAAGDMLYKKQGPGFLASDLLPLLPGVLKTLRK